MAPLKTFNDFIARQANSYKEVYPIDWTSSITAASVATGSGVWHRAGVCKNVPNPLPTGVTSYVPTVITLNASIGAAWMAAYVIDMGSINLGTNVFTDGAAAPTKLELGTSRQQPMLVMLEVTTVLNATPGNITITYKDQDGNTAEAGAAISPAGGTVAGAMSYWNGYNSPDIGVVDITNCTQSGGTTPSGVIKFWGIIPLASGVSNPGGNVSDVVTANLLVSSFNYYELPAGARVDLFINNSLSAKRTLGDIVYTGQQA